MSGLSSILVLYALFYVIEVVGSNISYFAICLIVKNDLDIIEWIEYHKKMGCSKFYVYDNHSVPPMNQSISSFITSGLVQYQYIQGMLMPNPQIHAYRECIQNYKLNHTFMVNYFF
jgi:hypothetical protein